MHACICKLHFCTSFVRHSCMRAIWGGGFHGEGGVAGLVQGGSLWAARMDTCKPRMSTLCICSHMAQPSCKTLIGASSLMHLSCNTAHNFPAPLAAAGHRCAPLVCSLEARPSTAAAQVGAAKLIVHACKMHQGAGEGLAWFRGVAGVLHACHGLSTCMHASMSTLHLCSSLARHSCRRAMWGGGFDGEGWGEGLPGSGRELVCCAHAITSANTCMRASARCGFAV